MKGNDAGTAVKPHGDSAGKKNGMAALGRSYTVLFVICALLAFLPYMILGRSFVYRVDGASQYIVYLRYMGQYLREWISRMSKGIFVPVKTEKNGFSVLEHCFSQHNNFYLVLLCHSYQSILREHYILKEKLCKSR